MKEGKIIIMVARPDGSSNNDTMSDSYYALGSFHRQITTNSPEAQKWFDRGLVWTYGFNHEEASRCFRRAIDADPSCTIAHWGHIYVLGPNYNKPWESLGKQGLKECLDEAHGALRKAKCTVSGASSVEKALLGAVEARYPLLSEGGPDGDGDDRFSLWNREYAEAMKSVYQRYPDDLDVCALYADALMNLTPWNLWDLRTGRPVQGARTLEAKEVLEKALAHESGGGGLQHPGLLHMYIHLMEMSGKPESALAIADHLRGLIPDAGHLNHMPTHLDVLCGEYSRAVFWNSQAIRADEKYLAKVGPRNFYTLYRAHNYHFRLYAAMFSGQSRVALDTVACLEATIPHETLCMESPAPMADWLEGFLAMRVHVLVRFGRWREILALKVPSDTDLYCATTAFLHYGKGVANAALGEVEGAETERTLFRRAVAAVKPSRTIFNNTCVDILAIARAMLDGEVEYRKGDVEGAFAHLNRASELDKALPYDEPWGWMQPPRHAYGALLLEQGRVEDARQVYATDLGLNGLLPRAMQHPNNVWSLHGLYECLVKLKRYEEARTLMESRLDRAMSVADIPIRASCFCRLEENDASRNSNDRNEVGSHDGPYCC